MSFQAATKRRDELKARLEEVQKGISAAQVDLAESLATITEGGGDKSVLENVAPAGDIVKDAEALKAKLVKQAEEVRFVTSKASRRGYIRTLRAAVASSLSSSLLSSHPQSLVYLSEYRSPSGTRPSAPPWSS